MFRIRYALGGGFGGVKNAEWEDCPEAENMAQAEQFAYEMACQEYENYDGLHGLRTVHMIMEEDGLSKEEAGEQWKEERESWLDYEARQV